MLLIKSFLLWLSVVIGLSYGSFSENYSISTPLCQLQLECIGSNSKEMGRVRIPIRSALGPPGATGPPGPPGKSGKFFFNLLIFIFN